MRNLKVVLTGAAFLAAAAATAGAPQSASAGGVKFGFGYQSGGYHGGHKYYKRRKHGHIGPGLIIGLGHLFSRSYNRKQYYGYKPSYSGSKYPSYKYRSRKYGQRKYSRTYDYRPNNYSSGYGNTYGNAYDSPPGNHYQGKKYNYKPAPKYGTKYGKSGNRYGRVLGGGTISRYLYNYGYRRVLNVRYYRGPYNGHGYRYRRGVYVAQAINPYGQRYVVYVDPYSGQHLRRYPLGGRTYTY